jgi:mono/diheme cytochrome c family protein
MKKTLLFIFPLLIVMVQACKHQPEIPVITVNTGGSNNGGGGGTDTTTVPQGISCDPDTVYFVNDILPFINNNCSMSGCHDAAANGDDRMPLTNYSQINSRRNGILNEMVNGSMPPYSSGITLTAEQLAMYQTWLNQGHLNNECTQACDPNQAVTYSGVIWPIIHDKCQGCHSGGSPAGGVALTNYAEVYDATINGNLLASLTASNGVSIMPKNTTGLPSCQIDQFQAWANASAPNN